MYILQSGLQILLVWTLWMSKSIRQARPRLLLLFWFYRWKRKYRETVLLRVTCLKVAKLKIPKTKIQGKKDQKLIQGEYKKQFPIINAFFLSLSILSLSLYLLNKATIFDLKTHFLGSIFPPFYLFPLSISASERNKHPSLSYQQLPL